MTKSELFLRIILALQISQLIIVVTYLIVS